MSTIRLYDLLNVTDAPAPDDAAAALWPSHLIQGTTGRRDRLDFEEARAMVKELDATLSFQHIRPGVSVAPNDPDSTERDRVGLMADLLVGAVPPALPVRRAAPLRSRALAQPAGTEAPVRRRSPHRCPVETPVVAAGADGRGTPAAQGTTTTRTPAP